MLVFLPHKLKIKISCIKKIIVTCAEKKATQSNLSPWLMHSLTRHGMQRKGVKEVPFLLLGFPSRDHGIQHASHQNNKKRSTSACVKLAFLVLFSASCCSLSPDQPGTPKQTIHCRKCRGLPRRKINSGSKGKAVKTGKGDGDRQREREAERQIERERD